MQIGCHGCGLESKDVRCISRRPCSQAVLQVEYNVVHQDVEDVRFGFKLSSKLKFSCDLQCLFEWRQPQIKNSDFISEISHSEYVLIIDHI